MEKFYERGHKELEKRKKKKKTNTTITKTI